jgi:acyl-coenzyme A thioesterase PaaI-like protein
VTVRALKNSDWGFESNCFVCSPDNDRGLNVPFFHDDEHDVVFAEFTPPDELQGAPTYVHGGATLAVLDEAMAWAAIAVGHRFAVTHETAATFDHPVRIGRGYRVEARLTEPGDERFRAEAVVLDAQGRPCVRAHCTLVVLTEARAVDAIGAELNADDASFTRPD